MRDGVRTAVVVDLNVLDGLKPTALPRSGFDFVLGKVLYAEILGRRLKAGQEPALKQRRAARGLRGARVLVEGSEFTGRVSIGESMEDLLFREQRPMDVDVNATGVIPGSSASLDSWREALPDLSQAVRGDVEVQRNFNRNERAWVDRIDLSASQLLDLLSKPSVGGVDERMIDRVCDSEIRGAVAWMAERLYGDQFDDDWRAFITSSPESCLAAAVGRVAALSIHYTLIRAGGPEQRLERFANNYRDLQYALLASYVGSLCTEDKGLVDACNSIFGSAIQVYSREEVFELPD